MKNLIITVILIFVNTTSFASETKFSPDIKHIFQKIQKRLVVGSKPNLKNIYHLFGYDLSNETIDVNGTWQNAQIFIFNDINGKVYQIAIEAYDCNVLNSTVTEKRILKRFKTLVEEETRYIFNQSLKIDQTYFKNLGPGLNRPSKVFLKELNEHTKKIRLKRGFYKCDAKSGYGFRIDFFIKYK